MEEAVERCSAMLEYMARGILRDEEAVEDCLARVWLRAVERQEDYDPGRGAVSTWLAQLCRSTALDLLRERRRNGALAAETLGEELADSAPGPEEELLRAERARRLRAALDRLGEADGCSTGNITISSPPPSSRRSWGRRSAPWRAASTASRRSCAPSWEVTSCERA